MDRVASATEIAVAVEEVVDGCEMMVLRQRPTGRSHSLETRELNSEYKHSTPTCYQALAVASEITAHFIVLIVRLL